MLNVNDLDIEINRGDAAGLTFVFDGEDAPEDGTKVIFQVRPADRDPWTVLQKEAEVVDGKIEIAFLPEDTADLKLDKYYWNACIQYLDGLEPWTVMRDWQKFIVLP